MSLGDRVENALDSALVDQHETEPHDKLVAEVRKVDAVVKAAKPLRRPKFTTFKGDLIYYINEAEKAKLVQALADLEDGG